MELRNAKEVRKKVEEITKNRTKCTENSQKCSKNMQKSKNIRGKKVQKSKIKWWKAILVEYLMCFGIVVTCWCLNTMKDYYKIYNLAYTQQQTIKNLVEWLQDNAELQTSGEEVCPSTSLELQDLGQFRITFYDACRACCSKTDGITASGKHVEVNKTIAVDPKVIPLGSKVMIDGTIYEAQDTGSAIKGNKIDIYVATHQEALNLGIQYKNVYLVKE